MYIFLLRCIFFRKTVGKSFVQCFVENRSIICVYPDNIVKKGSLFF